MKTYKCVLDHSQDIVSGCPICYWENKYDSSINDKLAQSDKFLAVLDKIQKDLNKAILGRDKKIKALSVALKKARKK